MAVVISATLDLQCFHCLVFFAPELHSLDSRTFCPLSHWALVSAPGCRPLDVTGAARGEAEGVDHHMALVGRDCDQLVVHVLLLAHSHVSG